MKKKIIALCAAAMMTLSFASCGQKTDSNKKSQETTKAGTVNKTVTVAMPSSWSDMYPMGEASHYDTIIFDQVYDALVKQNGDGTFVGDLAESWKVNDKSDEITFKLKKNVKWHNGDAFTPEDIVESFRIYSNPKVKSTSRYYMQYIAGVDDSGAETGKKSVEVNMTAADEIKIKLKKPTFIDTVLDDLTHIFIVQGSKLKDLAPEKYNEAATWAKPNGTGAFKYVSEVDKERMEFALNNEYFDGKPDIEKLVIRVVKNSNLLPGFMNGEIDSVIYGGLPLEDWDLAKKQENLKTVSEKTQGYQLLIFNCSKPYLNQNVRQALNMSIDRKALVDNLLKGEGEAIITPLSSLSQYYDKNVTVTFDQEKAKEMLKKENFPMDTELKFYVPTGNAVREKAATLISEDLKKIGVKTKIVQVDFPAFMKAMKNGEEDLGIVGSGGSMNPGESLEMLQGSFNLCKLPEDNSLAKLLKESNNVLTKEKRVPLFNEFQKQMKEMAPYGYLFTSNNLIAVNKRIENVNTKNFATFNFGINKWKVTK